MNTSLRHEQRGHVRIIVDGEAIRVHRDDLVQSRFEAFYGLLGQTVNQVDAHRFEAVGTRRLDDLQRLLFALDAVHRFLHGRIKILHADTDAVEPQLPKQRDGSIAHLARIDLDGIFAVFHQLEIIADRAHHMTQFVIAQESGGAAAEMQLFDTAILAQQDSLHFDLFDQVAHILVGLAEIFGNDFITGAIEAQGIAERDVDIQRQRAADAAHLAFPHPLRVHFGIKRLDEAIGSRIGGIARSILVQTTDQVQINFQLGAYFFIG